jgi:predicted DNA-binding transcriptional regulator YafY
MGERLNGIPRLPHRLRLSALEEIERWILSWGTRATVIRPVALAERIAQMAEQLARRYVGEAKGEGVKKG